MVTELPTNVTTKADGSVDDSSLHVIYVKKPQVPVDNPTQDDLKNTDIYKQVTRTINYQQPGKDRMTVTQSVIFGRTKSQNADGTYTYGDWKFLTTSDGKKTVAWAQYEIPQVDKYVSVIGKDDYTTAVKAQEVTANTQDSTVNVSYVPASNVEKPTDSNKNDPNFWKKVTRTINYELSDGNTPSPVAAPTVQTVWFKRSKVTTIDANGKLTNKFTEWTADGDASWPGFTIPQVVDYHHTEINGQRVVQIAPEVVTAQTLDKTLTVTYVSDGTDPYNQQVVPGLRGNWASIDNIYMTDTGIHVTGWNANSDSYNRNYHFLIILDYGPNPVTGQYHEVGRKLVAGGVNRPDVFKVHPVWNAATSCFDDTITLDTNAIKAGDKLRILSRWTSDPAGNNDPTDLVSSYYTMDYGTNAGHLDSFNVSGNTLEATGWNATNQVVGRPYHYVILYDATTNHEMLVKKLRTGFHVVT